MTTPPYKKLFANRLNYFTVFVLIMVAMAFTYCTVNHQQAVETNRTASIFPEYYTLTIPPNIAPLNFIIKEKGSIFRVEITGKNGYSIKFNQRSPKIKIPLQIGRAHV